MGHVLLWPASVDWPERRLIVETIHGLVAAIHEVLLQRLSSIRPQMTEVDNNQSRWNESVGAE